MKRKVVVNAVGVKDAFAGIGNVTLHVFNELSRITPDVEFTVYIASRMRERFVCTAKKIKFSLVHLPFNSLISRILWDQVVLPFVLFRSKAEILVSMINVACFLSPIRQVTYIHDLANLNMPNRFSLPKRAYLALTMRLTLKRSVKIIAVSNSTKKDIETFYPGYGQKVEVVHNGVNPLKEDGIDAVLPDKARTAGKFLLFVSTLEPGKNIIRMLEAFKLFVLGGHGEYRLLLAGSKGWFYNQVMDKIKELELSRNVDYLGYVSDAELRALYRSCAGFVFVSLYEGFGLPILEAMQHGAPVLCSNRSSMPEVGGEAVVYCDPESVQDIQKGMIELLKQDRDCLKKAYQKQLDRFTWKNSAEALNRVLKTI